MSDRTTWYEDCPKCGGKNTMQCYEQLGSNLKLKDCQNDDCDYYVRYDFTEVDGVINITEVPSERLASRKLAQSNSKSEDTPKCKRCGGDGFTSEHGCNPNYPESCAYTCPVQVQCEACEATGLEPPQDTSLDEPKACLCCNHVLAPLTNGLCFGCKEYLQTQQAKLLQVIEDEVEVYNIKSRNGEIVEPNTGVMAVPLEALRRIKERL